MSTALSAEENAALRERVELAVADGTITKASLERAAGYGPNGLAAFFCGRRGISEEGAARLRAALDGKLVAGLAPVVEDEPFRAAVRAVLTKEFAGRVPDMARELPMRALDLKRYLDGGRIRMVNRKRMIERFGLENAAGPPKRVKKATEPERPPPVSPGGAGDLAERWQEEAMGLILGAAAKLS